MAQHVCPNGHPAVDGDDFCGTCGAPIAPPPNPEAPPPPPPPPPELVEVPGADEPSPALSCPNGHDNPEANTYCGTCGTVLLPSPPIDELDPPPLTPVRDTRARKVWIAVAVASVAIIATVIVMNRASSSTSNADHADAEATTTTLISDRCTEELSQWMPYVTGPGTLTDAMAEFGAQAPEVSIIRDAYLAFEQNLYQVGRDDASTKAYAVIAQECTTLGDQYSPGHLPPQ